MVKANRACAVEIEYLDSMNRPRAKKLKTPASIHSRLRLLVGLPILGLVLLGALLGLQSHYSAREAARDERAVNIISSTLVLLTEMVGHLQSEREVATMYIYRADPAGDFSACLAEAEKIEALRPRFKAFAGQLAEFDAQATRQAVQQLTLWSGSGPAYNTQGGKGGQLFTLAEEREQIRLLAHRTPQVMRYYRFQIQQLFNIAEALLPLIQDREMKETMYAYTNIWYLIDGVRFRDLGVQILAQRKKFMNNESIDLIKTIGLLDEYRKTYSQFAPADFKKNAPLVHNAEQIAPYQAQVDLVLLAARENKPCTVEWAQWQQATAPLNAQIYRSEAVFRQAMLAKAAAMKSSEGLRFLLIVFGVLAVVLASVVFSRVIGGRIEKNLKALAGGLASGAHSLANASTSTTAVSDTLSDEASKFAAAMEEMSATTEEISSMLRQSASHATETDTKTQKARATAQTDLAAIRQLTESMQRMDDSSRKIAKIIKGIDEIAFQTNILALNAAIEAARAGEAGAGFAVVADEVRALAARSAKAAQESSEIISASTKESIEGRRAAQAVLENFQNLLQTIEAIAIANSNIASSFQQQSQGVGQINESIGAQSNTAQHLASASQEMAGNARQLELELVRLRESVASLQAMAGQKSGAAKKPDRVSSAPESDDDNAPEGMDAESADATKLDDAESEHASAETQNPR